jgi:hypothetical protein
MMLREDGETVVASLANYPDVLGYITGGQRFNLGVVQLAMAVHPRIVRAGRPFEVKLLIQNASDVNVDVTATLKLPEYDAAKQSKRFIAKRERLVIGLHPAEMGCLALPVTTLPNTAVGQNYQLGLDVKVQPVGDAKPGRIRLPEGGGEFNLSHLPQDKATQIEALKAVKFDQCNLRGSTLSASFSIMSGKVGEIADLKPGWQSLWTLKDYMDDRILLEKYRRVLKEKVLPQLDRRTVFKPLLKEVQQRFESAGFKLDALEAVLITKLLTLILEYSSPTYGTGTQLTAGIYNITPYLDKVDYETEIHLPKWVSAFLRALHQDARVADYPEQAVVRFTFDALLRDAMARGLEMVEIATGEDIGKEEERQAYIDRTLQMLCEEKAITFSQTYMPLVMGGIVAYDTVMFEDEKIGDLLNQMRTMLDSRTAYKDDDTEAIFKMTDTLIDHALTKYSTGNKFW